MKTLVNVTEELMARQDLHLSEVEFIGSRDGNFSCDWNTFEQLAQASPVNGYTFVRDFIIKFDTGHCLMMDPYFNVDPNEPLVWAKRPVDIPNVVSRTPSVICVQVDQPAFMSDVN